MPERGLKTSTLPVGWATFGIFSTQSKWFTVANADHGRNLVISTWPETKQQSIVWRHSSSAPPPKKFRVRKSARKVLASIVGGSRRHHLHWLSSKGPNNLLVVLLISAGAIEGHFEGKTPPEIHQVCLVLARKCPGSPVTCNPEEIGLSGRPIYWSPTLFSECGPVALPLVPWTY